MNLNVALVYLGFFGLIALAVILTESATPLWALLLTPTYKDDNKDKGKKSCS